ncbi:DUF6010 family protein [Flavihumibacter sp.]|uniref:DUF6010 family protein n=1 Tax=Flavihumibacter sp. TaxID=1913981 RepID=UPI002FC88699
MTAALIGISSGLVIIFLFILLKQFDKKLIYGLILCGIGFLYVGFTWTNLPALIVNCIQAVVFMFLAYYGVKKSLYLLAGGYFLHGTWDLLYHLFQDPGLIPPQYDLFCLSIDFTIGFYILLLAGTKNKNL